MIVQMSEACQSIDPAPVQWRKGNLSATHIWNRLGIDVTHVGSQFYLTIIDCGPSRFAIWRLLHQQDTASIIPQLESIFYDRGSPTEILTNNSATFSLKQFSQFLRKWDVRLRFRCAYVPAGNSIVERSHRPIKVIAARKRCSILEAVFWYNATSKDGVSPPTAPANMVHAYHLRLQSIDIGMSPCKAQGKYRIGDVVCVKTPHSNCIDKLRMGYVIEIISLQSVRVDRVPCHVKDLQQVVGSKPSSDDESDSEDSAQFVYLVGGHVIW